MNENNIGIIKLYEKKEISIMCGIIGFTGKLKAQDVLLTGLASLEYRGYDSAGIAYFKDTGKISLRKTVGKVKDLRAICDDDNNSTCGIGHTRWATHGGVTNANAHPHKVGQVALIHNGIIENYHDLATKYDLTDELISETDTEVAAALAFPLALSLSNQLGVSPMPFFVVICIAASASFSTPIGYQTNLIVQGIGNYKFTDFVRIGLPLNILTFIISVILIPLIWPF